MDSKPLPEKKKRGRKSKKELEMMKNLHLEKQEEDNEIKQPKKRGRKPRGGKIFPKINTNNSLINEKNNIILHLKCSMSDIDNKIYDINSDPNDTDSNTKNTNDTTSDITQSDPLI